MNVLMLSPGFPAEMPLFTHGLAAVGARVIGLGDQPPSALPLEARKSLSAYVQVGSFGNEAAVLGEVRRIAAQAAVHHVECLWEPLMILAAKIREDLGVPGLSVEQTIPFRDKEIMKQRLDAAGIRTPRHARVRTVAQCRQAAEKIGFPLVVKPIAGAGSADTYRIDQASELERVLPLLRHVDQVSVEEFIEGEDHTYDALCIDGEIHHFNIAKYRPRALVSRTHEWVSQQTIALRNVDAPELSGGRAMGEAVLKVLGFQTGFTHMEWFLTPSGEAVFGEIAARPPGARLTDLINFASDIDMFEGWAEAVCHRRFSQTIDRKYNAAFIIKRAQGQGRISRIEGLSRLLAELGEHVCVVDLLPIGAPRRDWLKTLVSDGMIVIRHPDLQTTLDMADRFGSELQLYAE